MWGSTRGRLLPGLLAQARIERSRSRHWPSRLHLRPPAPGRRRRVIKWLWPALTDCASGRCGFDCSCADSARDPSKVLWFASASRLRSGAGGQVAVSPDGRRLAYTGRGPRGEMLLWVHAFDAIEDRPLAGTEEAAFPFWSPDSRNLGFFAQGKLKRIDLSRGTSSDALRRSARTRRARGTPKARLFLPLPPSDRYCVFLLPAASPRHLSPAGTSREPMAQRWPQFLPDGRHFLYWTPAQAPQVSGVFVGRSDSPEVKALILRCVGCCLLERSPALRARQGSPCATL